MQKVALITVILVALAGSAAAQNQVRVNRISASHTEIVIHDQSAAAYQARREQARGAQRRLDEKRRLREQESRRRERDLQAQIRRRSQARTQSRQTTRRPPRYNHKKRPSFFNGGRSASVARSTRFNLRQYPRGSSYGSRPGRSYYTGNYRPGPIFRSCR